MVEWLSVVDVIYEEIMISIALGTGIGIIGYIRGILKKEKANSTEIDNLCKRSWRIERAILLFMKITINENKKNHGDSTYDEVRDLVNLILKDSPESTD